MFNEISLKNSLRTFMGRVGSIWKPLKINCFSNLTFYFNMTWILCINIVVVVVVVVVLLKAWQDTGKAIRATHTHICQQ